MTYKIHDPESGKKVEAETIAEAEQKLIEFWEDQ